jgi:hypothetical protein
VRVGEPVYALKIIVGIREEHFGEAATILRDQVGPVLRASGLAEVIALARPAELNKLDPESAHVRDSPALRRLLEDVPAGQPRYANDLRAMHGIIANGGPYNMAAAYALHHKRRRHPNEYEALRREHFAEENQLRVAGRWLDLYAVYASEADMKADTLDTHNRKKNVPYSAEFTVGKLKHLLFLKPCGVGCTVVERASREPPGSAEAPAYAARTPLSFLFRDSEGAEGHTRSLIPDLGVMRGFEGAFVLESRREGFDGALGWVPDGIGPPQASGSAQREGHPDSEERERRYRESARQELVSLWETEEDARLGGEWMAMSLRGTFTLPHRGPYIEHAEVCVAL